MWLAHARVNGKIPGGCIARLGDRVKEFVRGNLADTAGEPYAKRMEPLVPRLDGAARLAARGGLGVAHRHRGRLRFCR